MKIIEDVFCHQSRLDWAEKTATPNGPPEPRKWMSIGVGQICNNSINLRYQVCVFSLSH